MLLTVVVIDEVIRIRIVVGAAYCRDIRGALVFHVVEKTISVMGHEARHADKRGHHDGGQNGEIPALVA